MAKKSFKNSARASVASVFLSTPQNGVKPEKNDIHAHEVAQEVAHEVSGQVEEGFAARPARRPSRTQGVKGQKKARINMAFDPDIYAFIQRQSKARGKNMTEFVNDVIYAYMQCFEE